jgi:uncharacterized repeat protein (TIGR01451 family)
VKVSFLSAFAAAATTAGLLALPPASAATPPPPRLGVLAQPAGVAGCIQDSTATAEGCDPGAALTDAGAEAMTPDGRFLFVGGTADGGSIAVFSRDALTGQLSQAAGTAGCASLNGVVCTKVNNLSVVTSLAANNTTLYVGTKGGRILGLTIGSDGSLSRPTTPDACAIDVTAGTPSQTCAPAQGIPQPYGLAISHDGAALYVVSPSFGKPASDPTGSFAAFNISHDDVTGHDSMSFSSCYQSGLPAGPPPPPTSCTAATGLDNAVAVTSSPSDDSAFVASFGSGTTGAVVPFTGAGAGAAPGQCFGTISGCTLGSRALNGATDVAVSPTLTANPTVRQLYVTSQQLDPADRRFTGGGIARLNRDASNVLSQPTGTAGCIVQAEPAFTNCATGRGLIGAGSIVASPDGAQVYAASSLINFGALPTGQVPTGSSAVTMFDRDTASGDLAQPAGAEGCIASAATEGCAVGRGLKGPGRYAKSLVITPGGGQLYAAADQSKAVAEITRHGSDLRMSAVADPGPYVVGQGYNVTLKVLNAGPVLAHNVVVRDVVSSGGAVLGVSSTQGSCTANPTTCALGSLAPDASATVIVRVTPVRAATFTNTALVGADEGDILPADNTTVTSFTTGAPVLTIQSGAGQAAKINTAFAAPIKAALKDGAGTPLVGVQVTFTAPSSGASALFAGATSETTTTNASGVATSSTPVANSNVGDYTVTVSSPGASPKAVALTNNLTGPTPSATPTATITPTATPTARIRLTLNLTSPSTITPGIHSTMSGSGRPGEAVILRCYSRTPQNSQPGSGTPSYFNARSTTLSSGGSTSFSLNPGTNTRCFLKYADVADSDTTSSNSIVQRVATALSLSAYRDGVRRYHFQGTILPHRSGQLITLYRVTSSGQEIRTSTTTTDATGVWRINRTFTGSGEFRFRARTGQTLTNVAGVSNTRLTIIH